MKRILSILIGIIAFTGCEMAEVDPNANDSLVINAEMVNYQIGMDLGDDTKTHVNLENEQYKIYWSEGDEMNIFAGINNDNADKLVLVDGENTKNGSFYGPYFASTDLSESLLHQTVLVYPFDEDNTCVANDDKTEYTIGMTIPSVQKYTAGTFANGAYPMVGVTQTPKEIVVNTRNVNAAIVIPLKGNVSISKIVLSAERPLAGPATVKAAYGSAPVATINPETASYKVELVCEGGVELNTETATDFHISFAPCGDCSVDATIYATDGTYMVLKGALPSNDGKFDSNDYVVMPVVEYAQTGDQKKDLKEAFKNGGIFTLQSDLTIPYHVEINSGKSLTVDLNGYTLTCTADLTGTAACFKINKADLRFKNGTIVRAKGNYIFTMSNYASSYLGLTDVNIKKSNSNGGVVFYSNGINAEFTNVNVDAKSDIFCTNAGSERLGNITIDGGRYKSGKAVFFNAISADAATVMSVTFEGEPMFSDKSYAAVKWEETGDATYPYTPGGVFGATVGGVGYVDLQEAVTAAISSGKNEIKLASSVQLTQALVIDGAAPAQTKSGSSNVNVTIDLNGKTITSEGDVFDVRSGATLTLNGKGTVKAGSNGQWVAVWANGGNVIINGGNYSVGPDANGKTNDCIYAKGGQITINGGVFTNQGEYVSSLGGVVINSNNDIANSKIIINGGTFNPAEGCVPYEQKDVEANRVVVNTVASEAELKIAVAAGIENIILGADITLSDYVEIRDKVITINLNGKNIVHPSTSSAIYKDVFEIFGSGELTINGEGSCIAEDGYTVYAAGDSRVTLNNGYYFSPVSAVDARKNAVVTINGGEFKVDGSNNPDGDFGQKFTLNLRDKTGNYTGDNSAIIVKGGKFYKFNPADNAAEGEGTNFVAPGYSSVANGEYYEVKLGVFNETALKAAIAAGETKVTLADNIVLEDAITISNNLTLDLGGKTLSMIDSNLGKGSYAVVLVNGGNVVIENGTIATAGTANHMKFGAVWAYGSEQATVTIKKGTTLKGNNWKTEALEGQNSCIATVYVSNPNCTITIEGGEFYCVQQEQPAGQNQILNILEKNDQLMGDIVVKGGIFHGMDPRIGNGKLDGSYVADGYSTVEGGDGTYVVSQN